MSAYTRQSPHIASLVSTTHRSIRYDSNTYIERRRDCCRDRRSLHPVPSSSFVVTLMFPFFSDVDASLSQKANRHASRASRSVYRTRTDRVKRIQLILFIVSTLVAVAKSQSDASSRWVRVCVRRPSPLRATTTKSPRGRFIFCRRK